MSSNRMISPLTLVVGGDAYLNELNAKDVRDNILLKYSNVEVLNLDASCLSAAAFNESIGPCLLSDGTIIVIDNLQQAEESLVNAIESFFKTYMSQESSGTNNSFYQNNRWVIARHEGGLKGKSIITRLSRDGARVLNVPDLKKFDAQLNFVMNIFERSSRSIAPDAAQRLVSVLGGKTEELASLCSQLCYDFDDNPIDLKIVDQYLISNTQVTGFFVADKAVSSNASEAILAVRTAISQGVDPIAIIGALGAKMRIIAKAIAIKNGEISQSAAKVNPWALNIAMKQLAGWYSDGVCQCIKCLAWADEQCKGGSNDPNYALEKCIMLIASRGKGKNNYDVS